MSTVTNSFKMIFNFKLTSTKASCSRLVRYMSLTVKKQFLESIDHPGRQPDKGIIRGQHNKLIHTDKFKEKEKGTEQSNSLSHR